MKKLFLLLSLTILSFSFYSCSEEEPATNNGGNGGGTTGELADNFVGVYDSQLSVVLNAIPVATSQNDVEISKASANTINFTLKNFSFQGVPVGDPETGNIELTNVEIVNENNSYTFTKTDTLMLNLGDVAISEEGVPVKITSGKFVGDSLKAELSIPVAANLNVTVNIKGAKK